MRLNNLPKGTQIISKIIYSAKVVLLFSFKVMSNSFATPWTAAYKTPLSMGFPMQEYWSGLLFPSPGDVLTQGLNPSLLHW